MTKRISVLVLVVLGASWFFPVSCTVGTRVGMSAICLHEHCSRDMSRGDQPSVFVRAAVQMPSQGNKVVPVQLGDLDAFLKDHADASLMLTGAAAGHADVDGFAFDFKVIEQGTGYQIIETRYFDDLDARFRYRATTRALQPLTTKVDNAGYVFSSLPLGLLFAWAVRSLARYGLRRRLGT